MATRAESAGLSLVGSSSDDDDDLMIIHTEPVPAQRAANTFDSSLILPRPRLMDGHIRSVTPTQRETSRRRRTQQQQQQQQQQRQHSPLPGISHFSFSSLHPGSIPPLALPGQQQQQQQSQSQQSRPRPPSPQATAVIDLTEEPDSPVQTRAQLPPLPRNPRRTGSQRASAPTLIRSDGSAIPPFVTHIDLTEDSPEDDRPYEHHHRRLRPFPPRNGNNVGNRYSRDRDQLIGWDILQATGGLAAGFGRHLAEILGMEVPVSARGGFRPPELDVSLRAFETPPAGGEPKPPMEEVPPPREGFTRDTCGNPEEGSPEAVVICPACKEELAYDPTDAAPQGASTGAGKKRRRAPGEHHFWALKKCGHVYCADCFENRKPTKASPRGVGFRLLNGAMPISAPNDVRCAVDDCETRVAQKTEWVGIFL